MSTKRGIYLVANFKSQELCENLIYSIRQTGCLLPIRVIHFGGKAANSPYILENTELIYPESFPQQAVRFIDDLQSVLDGCPRGFLNRFLAFFSDWDEFIYSDNDIVALCNWNVLFDHLKDYDLVHADEEYTTKGIYNYFQPQAIEEKFGEEALLSAFTAGHFAAKRSNKLVADIEKAIQWFRQNHGIPKRHDQALLHVASLLGNWNMLNLCRSPNHWMSSWAGDYKSSFDLISKIQGHQQIPCISHIHYSGGHPTGIKPIEDLIFASLKPETRLQKIIKAGLKQLSGISYVQSKNRKAIKKLKAFTNK